MNCSITNVSDLYACRKLGDKQAHQVMHWPYIGMFSAATQMEVCVSRVTCDELDFFYVIT